MTLPYSVTALHLPTSIWTQDSDFGKILIKNYTQKNLYIHSCTDTFSWAKWEISHLWGKTGGQKFHFLPHVLNTTISFQPSLYPLEKAMATPLQYSCLENPMDGGAL